ncbi:Bctsr1 [Botrytis cinerea B05.10]|uniref:Bctsr1 n=3 Tax=Botryotinia fuckeliana TaxID=40559 RepID=A0A384JRZ1_BOTFB|nr:Bctsr1 [Botrytis cinerea B05.10]ATZ53349.1 Bctsr1 [Botrytis cinerea B05.10]EMR88760.1 putative ribosome biogenesis protein tsr1 protein [Botrytis cinerea BcDW1]CCD44424.1 similar to pre-rRNA processing protein Tsr1 [Botrytis cinerea T4]
MAPAPTGQHSHRSTTKTTHKAFKSRKASKGALKELSKGKVQDLSHRKSPHQQLMSKFDRRNQARQKQNTKHKEHQRDLNVFQGRDGAPRIVALVPLCDDANAAAAVRSLTGSLDVDIDVPEEGIVRADIDRFKQKVQYIITKKELFSCMNASRVADFVVFILSPEQEVDELGELIIRSVESQGLSTTLTVVQGLDKIEPPKRRPGILSSLKSYVQHFHPDQEKVHNLDSRQECANLMRSLCTLAPKGIRWREERSWMLVDEVQWPTNEQQNVVLTGFVRGKGLKADRLISVGDWGDFQIEKITAAPLASKKRRTDEMATDDSNDETVLETPGEDQDDLAELAPEGIMMEDDDDAAMSVAPTEKRGVLLDDHHYFSDDETHLPAAPKRLPKGTSNYQSAWFLGDHFSDSGSDMEDFDDEEMTMDTPALPQDGAEGLAPREPTEAAPSEYPQSEMFLDPNPDDEAEAEQLAAFRRRKTDEAAEDREFPDEIELHPNVLARERLAKFRGLKSLRTSPWEEAEDRAYEPEDWRRLLQVPDYKSSRSQVTREALVGGVAAGTRVHVHLRNVPSSLQSTYNASQPLSAFSLLRHEHKKAVLNINFTLSSDYPSPIKSKSEMIVQCGPRRFVVNPLFSQGGNTPNDVHKFDRFLHPGQSTVASFIGPLSWGSIPTLFFQRPSESAPSSAPLLLIGTGTSLPPSTSRIIAKRIILTGHPYKIHKRLVTVRYMFFNREDVEWFKALQLWTKRGRSGFIKESLGTHGYFKATFDGKINPQDAVGVSLYKRMWPRNARSWDPVSDGLSEDMAGDRDVAME